VSELYILGIAIILLIAAICCIIYALRVQRRIYAKFAAMEQLKAAREGLRQAWYRQGGRK